MLKRPLVVAEIGCNHRGDPATAAKMVSVAAECGADFVKFQKRHVPSMPENRRNAPHPNPHNSYGSTYGEHRQVLELTVDHHKAAVEVAEELGITAFTSVWDVVSAKEMAPIYQEHLKIPSACNTDHALVACLADEYGGTIHLSLGMTTREEEERVVRLLYCKDRLRDTVLYHSTSGYPIEPQDACLLELQRLRADYGVDCRAIGYSGHHNGIALDLTAFAMGAQVIERHFTLDRTWRGTDHAASLEPAGLTKLVRDLRAAGQAMTFKPGILECEIANRLKLKELG